MSILKSPDRRCVVLILDGLGDLPVAALDGKTPLEAARTPNLDRLATLGHHGLVDPVEAGVVPNTHTGVGILFGLRPEQRASLNRGPVEAAGADVKLEPGDVAFRANLATLEKREAGYFVSDRRAGRVTGDAPEFAALLREIDLGDGVTAQFHATDQHRGALVFRGQRLGGALGDTDPGDRGAPGWLKPCQALEPGSEFAASKVDRFISLAHERLAAHPKNRERLVAGKKPVTGVITRGAGVWSGLDGELTGRGFRPVLVAGCNTVIGLAKLFGLRTVKRDAFTAGTDTDVRGKLEAAREALSESSLVFVHIKAPDLFSHDFRPEGKRDILERIDRALGVLAGSGAAIAIASDHSTDSNTGAHTADPVPALIHVPSAKAAQLVESVNFGEAACRSGNLPRRTGHRFLKDIIAYLAS